MTQTKTTYGDWRDEIATTYKTLGPIPEHPVNDDSFGLWIDSGIRTGDDSLRIVIEIAERWAWAGVDAEYRHLVDADGWIDYETDPDGSDILHDIANDAESYLNDVISAYGLNVPESVKDAFLGDYRYANHEEWNVWAGWDGDIGGFGLWAEPDETSPYIHSWGEVEVSRLAGTVHRKCRGCDAVSLDGDEDS